MTTSIAVIGGTGDIGRGVVSDALARGWDVLAVGRDGSRLADLASPAGAGRLRVVTGSIATAEDARLLAAQLPLAELAAVVVAINAAWEPQPALAVEYARLDAHFTAYLRPHMAAATAFIPRLSAGAMFVALGGGMADFPARGMSVVSMAQAAQRMWIRHLEKESRLTHQVVVKEVMVHAMVMGDGAPAPAGAMTGADVGARVCDVISGADETAGPIVSIGPGD
ncbi:NAD(P)H-binding protein [Tomitella biformata]|uniref:NAD(P)H-binding protein n=1 Tax=Tomitella biformata TaxID=630403 RepID=UPI0004679B40|nr:NAD(P)H-binding protein [Tomitella biformata]